MRDADSTQECERSVNITKKKSSSDGIRTRVSALRGPRPRPLDNGARKRKAGELGFEPRQYESES